MESLVEYYLDPMNQIVHISLSIDRYAKNTALLARDLGISRSRLASVLANLENMQVIVPSKNGYKNTYSKHSSPERIQSLSRMVHSASDLSAPTPPESLQ